jgi:hypothetical protein
MPLLPKMTDWNRRATKNNRLYKNQRSICRHCPGVRYNFSSKVGHLP